MDPKTEAFVMALDGFAEAAVTLAEQWELASDDVADATEGYPFPNSFDEVAYSIREWSEKARKKLLNAA